MALSNHPLQIVSLASFSTWPKVVEDGKSFEENALKKARTLSDFSGYLTLADDSGLEVSVLGGAPGILSARYSGEEGNDKKITSCYYGNWMGFSRKREGPVLCASLLFGGPERWVEGNGSSVWSVREGLPLLPRGRAGLVMILSSFILQWE